MVYFTIFVLFVRLQKLEFSFQFVKPTPCLHIKLSIVCPASSEGRASNLQVRGWMFEPHSGSTFFLNPKALQPKCGCNLWHNIAMYVHLLINMSGNSKMKSNSMELCHKTNLQQAVSTAQVAQLVQRLTSKHECPVLLSVVHRFFSEN